MFLLPYLFLVAWSSAHYFHPLPPHSLDIFNNFNNSFSYACNSLWIASLKQFPKFINKINFREPTDFVVSIVKVFIKLFSYNFVKYTIQCLYVTTVIIGLQSIHIDFCVFTNNRYIKPVCGLLRMLFGAVSDTLQCSL